MLYNNGYTINQMKELRDYCQDMAKIGDEEELLWEALHDMCQFALWFADQQELRRRISLR